MSLHGRSLKRLRAACANSGSGEDQPLSPSRGGSLPSLGDLSSRSSGSTSSSSQVVALPALASAPSSPSRASSSSRTPEPKSPPAPAPRTPEPKSPPAPAPRAPEASPPLPRTSTPALLPRKRDRGFTLKAPEFTVQGGRFAEQVMVGLTCEQGLKQRYVVEQFREGQDESDWRVHLHTKLVQDGVVYRRPFVLDEYGTYAVHAACFREDGSMQFSEVVTQTYTVCATDVVPLKGKYLATLPSQMIRGMIRLAGVTTKAIAPRLESMRRAIARAADALEDQISVKMEKTKDKTSGVVSVSFSIRVAQGRDAESMIRGITDPSLVDIVSVEAKVPAKRIAVEAAVKPLESVLLHLSWTYPKGTRDYLDGSCLVYSEDRLLEVVDYRGAQSLQKTGASSATGEWSAGRGPEGSIVHSGDVMSSTGGRHAILVKLSELPDKVTECFFTLSAYYCRNLSKFIRPQVCFFDVEHQSQLLSDYTVEDAGCASAAVVCSLKREPGRAWSVIAYGQTCDGTVRDYSPIEASIAPVQARPANGRRRYPLVLLDALWHSNRAFPRGMADKEDVVAACLELKPELFRHVVSFI